MSRTLSLTALSSLLLATAVQAYAGSSPGNDGHLETVERAPAVTTRLQALTDAPTKRSDNCSVEGYPWLSAEGQLVES